MNADLQDHSLLDQEAKRWSFIRGLNVCGGVLVALSLMMVGYIFYRLINPRYTDAWGYPNSNTSIKWYEVVLPIVVAIILFVIAERLRESFMDDYVRVFKGTVVGLYQSMGGSYYNATTYFYVTIDGFTAAGVRRQFALDVSPVEWSQRKVGDEVDYS